MASVWGELKRRKVVKVAVAYAIVGWILVEVSSVIGPALNLPDWATSLVVFFVIMGFPLALVLSWAYELTPEGVVRDQGSSVAVQSSGRRMEYVFTGLLVIAVGTLLYREFSPSEQVVEVVAEQSEQVRLPNSVAVLPFMNLSSDPEDAFFAAGIHDTVLHELAKIRALNVIGRTSVLQYADGQTPISEIAETLNVETVLEATVQYADGQVRITAQLIDPNTGAHLWSGNYDRPFRDIFAIQSEIATRIAMALEAELLPAERESIEQRPTQSEAAYALYLKARALVPNIDPTSPQEFYDSLNRALAIDPDFALAHATLAFAYGISRRNEALARQHVEQALELDPNQGLAYAALAFLDEAYWRLAEAQSNFETALELSPNNFDVLDDAVRFFAWTGQLDKATPLAARARELNPADGLPQFWWWTGSKDHEGLLSFLRRTINDYPRFAGSVITRRTIGLQEAILDNAEAALVELRLVEELEPNSSAGNLSLTAYCYGRIGRSDDARQFFDRFQGVANENGSSNMSLAPAQVWVSLAIDDQAEALKWLEAIADSPGLETGTFPEKAAIVWNLHSDPILDQPEFVAVRSRLGFRE